MKVENARWNKGKYKCEHYRIQVSNSVKALREMQAGEVKRIIHDDVSCKDCGKICTIVANISRLKTQSWGRIVYEYYHEATGIIIVKRVR